MARINLDVNGKVHAIDADPDMPLLYALRNDVGLNNPHFGCGLAKCGACTVHLDGQAIRSCVTPLSAVGNGKVVTLAGLGTPEKPHPIQAAYVDEQVPQCGYCINGWVMTAAALLNRTKKPTEAQAQAGGKPPLTPDQLSSFIAVNADGSVSAFFGKMDMGQGVFTAIGQMVAEELDVPFKTVKVLMGDTATSGNQGGASGSTGIHMGGKQMRAAAAEARRVLVEMAAAELNVPADQLKVSDGTIHA